MIIMKMKMKMMMMVVGDKQTAAEEEEATELLSFTLTTLTTLIIIVALFVQTTSGFRSIETNANGAGRKLFGGYRITPKHCRATKTLPSSDPRSNGPTICMFNHECAQRGGEVVGACMDGFLFGACCQIPQTHELASTLINDAQNAYFQQHQQQQHAAQSSYENYGEQQLSEEEQLPSSSQNIDKVYQQLGSSSTPSNGYSVEQTQHEFASTEAATYSSPSSASSSGSVEFEQVHEEPQQTVEKIPEPPTLHVHKHSVKINSPSSPPQNDDFVMQVLSTLPPEHSQDHRVTFTTEVPMKLANLDSHASSESSSFEEPTSQTPAPSTRPPTRTTTTKVTTTRPKPKPKPKPVPQLVETMKRPKPKPAQQTTASTTTTTHMHHHNHLILDGGEFTHSDITHPGADADLVEDLQFSTGYGPQPIYVEPPKDSSSTQPSASAEDKYDQVPTYTDNNFKRPSSHSPGTTVSSITTHVDSIESIILQLNNTNHGPSYNVVNNQQTPPSYGGYPSSSQSATEQPSSEFYPEANNEADKSSYATTDITASYDKVSDEQDLSGEASPELPTARPIYGEDDTSAALEEHTMPATGYHDAISPLAPQTSEFNKMPVMGIAYPVDMSYIEEESGQSNTESSYQTLAQIPTEKEPQHAHPSPAYVRPTTNVNKPNRPVSSYIGMVTMQNYNTKKPSVSEYQGQLPAEVSVSSHTTKVQEDYAESPSSEGYSQPIMTSTTSAFISSTSKPLAQRPQYDSTYDTSSLRPVLVTASPRPRPPLRPQVSSKRPAIKKPINNESTKKKPQPASNYGQGEDESPITHIQIKKPSNSYNKPTVEQTAQTSYPQSAEAPASNYQQPEVSASTNYKQPEQTGYPQTEASVENYEQSAAAASTYQQSEETGYPQLHQEVSKKPPSGVNYDQPAPQPSLTYNEEGAVASSPARKPSTAKPVSTSYVTGPSTPRPPATVDYHYDNVPPLFMADDKLDAFIQSTAENIVGSTPGNYQPPLYATASTPVHVHRPTTANYGHKRPGFVQINNTPKPPRPTVLITPKPTAINLVTASPSASPVSSNDFEDPGYFGSSPLHVSAFTQSTTEAEALYAVPSDDKPAFPGYYGPTPTYPAFPVPGEKIGQQVANDETYTSPNDFVNFPPVRNPNLNMSAASSAVTSDLELSTPAFVEDIVLKDKMHTLVHKLVASLQGNFEALADMIDETNNTASTYQAGPISGAGGGSGVTTKKPTRKPVRQGSTTKPKATTTKKPVTRVTTKAPNKKTSVTTRKPQTANRRTTVAPSTVTTRKPTATKKPTRRVSTVKTTTVSSARPADDEIVDEEDEEDVNPNPQDNEVDQDSTLSSYGGANGRKIQCGIRPHVKSGRIVGGKGSSFGAFPWQVLVRESTWLGLFTKNKCGGVLITSRYVITAAHCQPGFLASLVAVMGEFDISGDLESKRPVTKNVKRVIVHRQYDPATFENDLALLEMDSPVQFDTHIVPICMPNDVADFTGRMATVTGWGRLKYGGGVPSVLQEVQVPIIENSVCQEMFHTAGHNKKILNSFLCAGYANGQKDSCEGDSGGPLVLQRPDGRYELAGTVSHGIKCAAPYLPGVYMRTTFYKPWLRSITGVK
ncbi:uncharacterized protein Dwil_GK17817 [Drosophila willistoni]|uniref:Peptidase S1 domain-containing protein n=2 Tax=Drosophila willistoni TaxID=7260 RepID=B4N629_DROWI|nr:uncharacterized protein Dwil_GK17817 [Drosophila willistoni]